MSRRLYSFPTKKPKIDAVLLKIGESYALDANKEGNSNLVKAEFYQLAAKHYANIGDYDRICDDSLFVLCDYCCQMGISLRKIERYG